MNLLFPASTLSLHFFKKHHSLCMQPVDFCVWAVSPGSFTDKQVEVGEKQISHNLFKPESGRDRAGEGQRFISKPQTHSSVGAGWLCVTGVAEYFSSKWPRWCWLLPLLLGDDNLFRALVVFSGVQTGRDPCSKNLKGLQHISTKHGKITEEEGGCSRSLKETARKLLWRSGSGLCSHFWWKMWLTNKGKEFSYTVIKPVRDWNEIFPPRLFLCLLGSWWTRGPFRTSTTCLWEEGDSYQTSISHWTRSPLSFQALGWTPAPREMLDWIQAFVVNSNSWGHGYDFLK